MADAAYAARCRDAVLAYVRHWVRQMRDRTVPIAERWERAHRMGTCAALIARGGPPYRYPRWVTRVPPLPIILPGMWL